MAKVVVSGNTFSNVGRAIKIKGDAEIDLTNNSFKNVVTPFDISPEATGRIVDNSILDDPKLQPQQKGQTYGVSSGWRRLHGPPLPSYCPECKNIFPSRNYVFAGTYFYCWGNTEECVVCGYEKAELSKGAFDLSMETVEVLRAPDITHEMIKRLAEIGADVAYGKLSPEEAAEKAAGIHPSFGQIVLKWGKRAAFGYLFLRALGNDVVTAVSLTEIYSDNQLAIQKILESGFYSLSETFYDYIFEHPWKENKPDNPIGGILEQVESDASGNVGSNPPGPECVEVKLPHSVPKPIPKPSK